METITQLDQKKELFRLLFKLGMFLSPFILSTLPFFLFDPFKVFYRYENYYQDYYVALNRDFVSTQLYLTNRRNYKYDSFILGNSRSLVFLSTDWALYLKQSSPFHFDASAETLHGIWSKIKFIHTSKDPVRNVLILICKATLRENKAEDGYLFIQHPAISHRPPVLFYFRFFRAYYSHLFFVKYLDRKIFKKYRPYMDQVIDNRIFEADPVTNDLYFKSAEEELARSEPQFYKKRSDKFYLRNTPENHPSRSVIGKRQLFMLKDIRAIFRRHKTRYKIIIPPLYDQTPFNQRDLSLLQSLFGKEDVFDYSGLNQFTEDIHNYYEESHFRPHVAREILKQIYSNS